MNRDLITEADIEVLAKEYGNPVPPKLKNRILAGIASTPAQQREADLLQHLESDCEQPEASEPEP